jgi:Ni,Fe-hydrogenase III large subunit
MEESQSPQKTFQEIIDTDRDGYIHLAMDMQNGGGRLVSVWGFFEQGLFLLFSSYFSAGRLIVGRLSLSGGDLPSITSFFPGASRMERALKDLWGVSFSGSHDHRRWLDHGLWNQDPLPRQDMSESSEQEDYAFVTVSGVGVHEIPVGPVHAGMIEPGHFRFQVVGEKVLRMEERLGYTHKGIGALSRNIPWKKGIKLAGRVSGDTTIGHSLAYALSIEKALGLEVPQRAKFLRGLLLERERIANHLGDIGALANDAGLSFGLSQFLILKEDFMRQNRKIFGHRLLMDLILPGGVSKDPSSEEIAEISSEAERILQEVEILQMVFDEHGGLQDRFFGTGILPPETARTMGLCGVVGRASGQPSDLRVLWKEPPFDAIPISPALETGGDVRARVAVRFFEAKESLRLIREILSKLPDGAIFADPPSGEAGQEGISLVEGWRGEILCWSRLGGGDIVTASHFHDPSWILWPALEITIPGNLVADFPLINKSFNPSYSGHDL